MEAQEIAYDVKNDALLKRFQKKIMPEAIKLLKEDKQPLWGRMTPQHMIEHLVLSYKASSGKIETPCMTPEDEIAETNEYLETNEEMPHGVPNPIIGNKLLDLHYPTFKKATDKLLSEVQDFISYYEENPDAQHTNPRFCNLNKNQWYKFHFKHSFHHLKQFGLLEVK